MTTRRKKAIAIIEDCRKTHVYWATYLRETPAHQRQEARHSDVGDIRHQEKWVHDYDLVLTELRGES